MERIGILVVAYGARASAMIDVFTRSQDYTVELYVADKQENPYNIRKSTKHLTIPDLNEKDICNFAKKNEEKIDFGIIGPEKPIVNGVRDLIESQTNIPIICPTKKYAIEASKVAQRMLFQEITPEVNPKFKIFNPKNYKTTGEVKKAVFDWLDELDCQAVVKPDQPAAGKGVGVWGDHFLSKEQLFEHFMANYKHGSVIIEEKVEGEESSFQALCDGKHLIPLPETRDYKRAFDNDKGPNTGGMGSYKAVGDSLPFMTSTDRRKEIEIVNRIFTKWGSTNCEGLRGLPFYVAFIHTGKGPKILENNSRAGDPEIINILPTLKDDFVDVCLKIIEGNLINLRLERAATVVTYKVPPGYGGYMQINPNSIKKDEIETPVDLSKAYTLTKKHKDRIRVLPASMKLCDNKFFALKSRAVAVTGKAESIEEARKISLEGIDAIKGGALWYRKDIASKHHIAQSIKHLDKLRQCQS